MNKPVELASKDVENLNRLREEDLSRLSKEKQEIPEEASKVISKLKRNCQEKEVEMANLRTKAGAEYGQYEREKETFAEQKKELIEKLQSTCPRKQRDLLI